ncbi:MAG: hypothetical protein ACK5LS_11910 [Propioniciclava sp.]
MSAGIDDYAEEDEVLRTAALFAVTAAGFLTDGVSGSQWSGTASVTADQWS